jgi:hypothetical protein
VGWLARGALRYLALYNNFNQIWHLKHFCLAMAELERKLRGGQADYPRVILCLFFIQNNLWILLGEMHTKFVC